MIALLLLVFAQSFEFGRYLENEGDIFRAIYEYKRIYFEAPDSALKDSVANRIAYLSLKIGSFHDALVYAERISDRDPLKKIKLGFPNLFLGKYDIAESYWQGNDTLLAWLYLKKGEVGKARFLIPKIYVNIKSPFIGGVLSALVPGSGKIYAGRTFDGLLSFLINTTTGYSAYRACKTGRDLEFYIYSAMFLIFYFGDIYGSYVAVKEYNAVALEKAIRDFEVRFNVWKYWF